MKYLPLIAVTAAAVLLGACAGPGMQAGVQSIGTSQKTAPVVTQCIAQSWADKTQQPITTQSVLANNQAADVLLPGQPPGGAAAVVRPNWQGSGTWVGLRSASGADTSAAAGGIQACL
ncbi:MAG: hypothetical protein WDN30_07050 [Pararobbsia sp.]